MINFLGILLVFSSLCPVEGTYCVIPNSLRHRIIGIWSPVKIPYKSSAQKTWREPKFWPGGTKNIKPSYETRVPYNIKDERSRYSIYAGHAIIVDCNAHIYGSKQFYIKTFLCNHYNSFYDKDCTSPSDPINSYTNNVNVLQATYMSVPDAVQYCKNNGGELATISSEYENDLALKAMSIRNVKSALIGFTDSNRFGTWEGTWKWMNNALVTYTNWYEDKNNNDWDQPNNYGIGEHHTMITLSQRGQYGKWFDVGPPRTDNVHIFPFNRAPFFCTLKSIGPRDCKVGYVRNGYLSSRSKTVSEGKADYLKCYRGYQPTFTRVTCDYPVLKIGICRRSPPVPILCGGGGAYDKSIGDTASGRSAGGGGGGKKTGCGPPQRKKPKKQNRYPPYGGYEFGNKGRGDGLNPPSEYNNLEVTDSTGSSSQSATFTESPVSTKGQGRSAYESTMSEF